MKKILNIKTVFVVAILFSAVTVSAWSGSSANPPNQNTDEPINAGADTQYKAGGLGVGGIFEVGANFSINDGNIEGVNSLCLNGDCKSNWPSGGSSLWSQNGSDVYYNDGKVGIGTTNSSQKLDVAGGISGNKLNIDNIDINGNSIRFKKSAYSSIRKSSGSLQFRGHFARSRILLYDNMDRIYIGDGDTDIRLRGDVKGVNSLCLGGDCKSSWPSGGSSLWSQNGSDVYYNDGKVGIGTRNPRAKLDVNGSIRGDRLGVENVYITGNSIGFKKSSDSFIIKSSKYLSLRGHGKNSRIWLQDNKDRIVIGDGDTDIELKGDVEGIDSLKAAHLAEEKLSPNGYAKIGGLIIQWGQQEGIGNIRF